MKTYFSILTILFLLIQSNHAQTTFLKGFGFDEEYADCVAQSSDGGYFVSGVSNYTGSGETIIIKTDCIGNTVWTKKIEKNNTRTINNIIAIEGGGCIIGLSSKNNIGFKQMTILKLSSSGNTEWNNTIPLGSNFKNSLKLTSNKEIIISGTSGGMGIYYSAIAKLDSLGNFKWFKKLSLGSITGIDILPNNNIVLIGKSPPPPSTSNLFVGYHVIMLDSNGNILNRKVFNTEYEDTPIGIIANNNFFYILANSYFLTTNWDFTIIKLDNELNIIGSKAYHGNRDDKSFDFIMDGNDLVITGSDIGPSDANIFLTKIDNNLSIKWSKKIEYISTQHDYPQSIKGTMDRGYIIAGDFSFGNIDDKIGLLKTDSDGNIGCHNSPFSMSSRNEVIPIYDSLVSLTDTSINNDFSPPTITDYNPFPVTTLCSNNVPCVDFTYELDNVCPSYCYHFFDNSMDATSWLWKFEDGSPSTSTLQNPENICFSDEGPKKVELIVSNANGSSSTSIIIETEGSAPIPEVNFDTDTTLCSGKTLILDIYSPNSNYLWQDGSTSSSYLVSHSGKYWVTVENRCGVDFDTITIHEEKCFCLMSIPNAFSPNGDEINDKFIPLSNCDFEKFHLLIFNRWGEVIFETENPFESWDGTFNNQLIQQGVYVYKVSYSFEDEEEISKLGHVTLLK